VATKLRVRHHPARLTKCESVCSHPPSFVTPHQGFSCMVNQHLASLLACLLRGIAEKPQHSFPFPRTVFVAASHFFFHNFWKACMNQEITGCVLHYTDHSFALLYSTSPFVKAHIFLGTVLPSTCHSCYSIIETDYIPHLSQYLSAIYSYISELAEMWFTVTQQKINSLNILNDTFCPRFKALNNN